ncbi:hypothetical protein HEQ62_05530 [Haematospirillum jordaniae]|uniref:Uncharacterized protein n=1 Tax=Haematospirillum jordaniae TaxID=1549855 RepID=A0A143DE32_9PROT|nr:hypothetical protein [Haematospirillum jordaniae]AMW34378.1 hypothetical protein AY555_03330 [Haematospirillum jordaniae]NKD44649.1 hypothetical protein [Haematospirillum jordaniae]NKD57669.1 hypothetical protein [Haematospirillum jordaniae]NKD59239.1 hypothetical protein [Haematospirillum jordaniae]NKD67377.1 hypothetical protein [Haematospirillum jordaniae]
MISIIVYGRNDSHGYNLHKRAAISLNCLAEMLGDLGDEIVFVDYNTPDDLPTFPESIRDTLTPTVWKKLRIIRVRSRDHEHIRLKTHLMAIEPIARNVGVRRSNHRNSWILSTNTDMVFIPRGPFATLSEAFSSLERGYYCLPRFEVPDTLWECFDRFKPRQIIKDLEQLGLDLHLKEVVCCPHPVQFDAPGDFQLVTREDFFAVGGFNEQMIHGWHVDSNFAKRMQIHFGDVHDATDCLSGFHLGHTRVVGSFHSGHQRPENDLRRFFDNVTVADVPACSETWGLNGIELEEFCLSSVRSTLFIDGLKAVLPRMPAHCFESRYELDTYDSLDYPVEHTVPHLLDLLINIAPQDIIGWFGTGASLLQLFGDAMVASGGASNPVWVAESVAHLIDIEKGKNIQVVADTQVLRHADVFVFEFGVCSRGQDGYRQRKWSIADMNAVAPVRRGFLQLVDIEAGAHVAGQPLRRIIAVNAMHNHFEGLVHSHLSVNRTPFSTRVRQGYVIVPEQNADERCDPRELGRWLRAAMGRRQPVPITEAVRLSTILYEMVESSEVVPRSWREALRVADGLLTLSTHPKLAQDIDEEKLSALRQRVDADRYSVQLRHRVSVPVLCAASDPERYPSRLSAIEDWEDPDFLRFARHYFTGAFAANILRRSRGIWFRCHVLAVLERLGWGDGGQRSLVIVGQHADAIHHFLSNHYHRVDVVLDGSHDFPHVEKVWCEPSRIHVLPALPRSGAPYGVVVSLVKDRFRRGAGLDEIFGYLAELADLVGMGGIVAIVCHMDLGMSESYDRFTLSLASDTGFAQSCMSCLGLEMLPAAPVGISVATLDRYAAESEDLSAPHFVYEDEGALVASSVWFFVRRSVAKDDGVAQLAGIARRINASLREEWHNERVVTGSVAAS